MSLTDAYRSLYEALSHGGLANNAAVEFIELDSEDYQDKEFIEKLKSADGILVPGGFGQRGIEGKLSVIKHARENKIPFLAFAWVCSVQLSNIPEMCLVG